MTLKAQHCPRTWLFGFGIIAALALVLIGVPTHAQPAKTLTKEDIAALQAKYDADLAAAKKAGLDRQFSPDYFAKADEYAAKGAAALKAGKLLEAREDYNKARWELPARPPDFPENIARVFGNVKLRHNHTVLALSYSTDPPPTRTYACGIRRTARTSARSRAIRISSIVSPSAPIAYL